MDITWEKLILWILAIILILVIIFFIAKQLDPSGTGAIGNFFGVTDAAGKTPVAGTP